MERFISLFSKISIFVLILVALSACGPLSTPAPTATVTPLPLPPTIAETVPEVGSELGPKATLLVFFSGPMDKASVEGSLSSDFADGFLLNWVDDVTLAITPKTAYPADGQVTFTLAASAKGANGMAIPSTQAFSYKTAGALRVSQVLPAPQAVDVSPDSAVVVSFNQPVVALGAENLPAGLTIEPAAPGKGEWLNTSTYIFHAEPGLAGGADYKVTVNPQLSATNGASLDAASQSTTWNFHTSLPRLLEVSPGEADGPLMLDPEIKLTFNQPMDRASVEAGAALNGPGGKLPGSFVWNDKSTVVTFKPSVLLERSTAYHLTVSGQSRSRGGATLGSDSNYSYQSVAPFKISSTPFPSGTTRPVGESIKITFTAPFANYKNNELNDLITISPNTDSEEDYAGYYIDGQSITVNSLFTPGRSYIITFSKKLKDRWGQELGEDYTFSFRQTDAEPRLDFGPYFMSTLFARPKNPLVTLQTIGINQLNVLLGSFSLSDYFRYQSDFNYQTAYTPNEIDSWSELLDSDVNQTTNYTLDLSRNGKREPLPTGLYYVRVSSPDVTQSSAVSLLISNVNLTLKTNGSQAFIWAMDLRTLTPVANTPVTIYDEKGNRQADGTTDANGLWQGSLPKDAAEKNIYATLAQPGDDLFGMAAESWNAEINPYNFGLRTGGGTSLPMVYFYTERPVYRPGDVVHYRGIIRNLYDGRYTDAGVSNLSVELSTPNGITTQKVAVSAYGSFNGEFPLSANAEPGYYNLSARKEGQDKNEYMNGADVYFQVAQYRKPEINLSASLAPDPATNGQALTGTINAAYFFDAPVSDLPFEWRLYKATSYFDLAGYSTGLYKTNWYAQDQPGSFGSLVAEGKARTGADGNFSLALDQIQVDDTASLTLEVTASESGGFPVSARATATLHPANFYIGVRPGTWFGRTGIPLDFDILTADLDKKAVPGKTLTANFQKVTWERKDLAYSSEFIPTYTPVKSQEVTTNTDGKTRFSFTAADPGTYMLEMTGEGAKTQVLIWVSGVENAAWPELPYQRMELTADQSKYKPGDTATVFIPGAFDAAVPALITTERSSVFSSQIVSVPPEGYTFTLPLTDDQAPNTYVAVTMLGPNQDFRQGYVNLPVEPSAFKLNVDLKATPEKAKPGDKLTLDLTVTDSKGQPVQGEFSMAVVDLAALALADPNSQEIVPAFYDIQPLGVSTGLTNANYARRGLPLPPGGKGGGGGGDVLTVREKFPDTAYWKADIVTDAQGKAQITLTLPDNLTTWQVDTRGLTPDTKVGQALVRVVTSKELLIRPQTPRFLVVGDTTELAAIVNNNTSSDIEATVSLQATGFSLNDPATVEQKVQVPAHGRIRVAWPGVVKPEDVVNAIFAVKSQGLQDSARPNDGAIPVLHYSAPQTFSTAGVLADAASRLEILAMQKSFKPLGGKLDVELSPSLASVLLSEVQADQSTPEEINWSNERLASDALSKLSTYQTMKDAALSNEPLSDSVLDDIRHLVANQNGLDHGWAWVTGYSQPSDPYVTAYILLALNQASKAGLDVKVETAITSGYDYLVAAAPFDGQTDLSQPWALNRAAFHNYVLQQIKSANLDTLDTLYTGRDRLDPWAKALLADIFLANTPNDERAKTLLSDLQSSAIRSATGAHWESPAGDGRNPNSPLLTTAMIVYVLSQRDPANPTLADAARYLAAQRGATTHWGSSYEKTWVILALNQYMKGTGELQGSFNFSAALNGAPLAKGEAAGAQKLEPITASAPLSQLYTADSNSLLVSREAGTGKLYYRAALQIDRPVESAPPLNQGLTVSREFVTCNGTDCQPVTSFQMPADTSGRVKVRVTVTLPNDAYYLMVQDNIPAGAEILDSSLKTSQQGEQSQTVEQSKGPQYDNANPFGDGWGWWYFNPAQIYNDHILWSANYLPAGTYVLTYTIVPSLPGQYRVLPAHAWQAYFPEVQGTSAGTVFEIKP